jgi:protein-tyrosine phosphatase
VIRYPRLWLSVLHVGLGLAFGAAAVEATWLARGVLGWTSIACFAVAVAYSLDRPAIFGKRADGSVSYLLALPVLPVLLVLRSIWFIRCKSTSERAFDEVAPGLIVGRRVMGDELPAEADFVIDLTSEFAEPRAMRERGTYRLIRTLDGLGPPRHAERRSVLLEAAEHTGTVYVHCAFGHGRAVAAAASIMVMRGHASDADDAFAKIRAARPGIFPSGSHHAFVTRVTASIVIV